MEYGLIRTQIATSHLLERYHEGSHGRSTVEELGILDMTGIWRAQCYDILWYGIVLAAKWYLTTCWLNSVGKSELPGLSVYKTHMYFGQDALYLLCTNGLPVVVLDGTYGFMAALTLSGSAKVIGHMLQSLLCIHTCPLGLSALPDIKEFSWNSCFN